MEKKYVKCITHINLAWKEAQTGRTEILQNFDDQRTFEDPTTPLLKHFVFFPFEVNANKFVLIPTLEEPI